MPTYLDRYLAGEREAVWAELTARGPAVREESTFSDAWAVARETMTRARRNVELLVERLHSVGYHFGVVGRRVIWDEPPHQPPLNGVTAAEVEQLEQEIGVLPLSVRAWFEIVGTVNFCGHHPDWDDNSTNWYGDPLVVWYYPDFFRGEYEEWPNQRDADDTEERFYLSLAPDALHKADVSGGMASGIFVPNAAMDAPFLGDWAGMYFVDYLRMCFAWGGFPGFQFATTEDWADPKPAPTENASAFMPAAHRVLLTEGLLPL